MVPPTVYVTQQEFELLSANSTLRFEVVPDGHPTLVVDIARLAEEMQLRAAAPTPTTGDRNADLDACLQTIVQSYADTLTAVLSFGRNR